MCYLRACLCFFFFLHFSYSLHVAGLSASTVIPSILWFASCSVCITVKWPPANSIKPLTQLGIPISGLVIHLHHCRAYIRRCALHSNGYGLSQPDAVYPDRKCRTSEAFWQVYIARQSSPGLIGVRQFRDHFYNNNSPLNLCAHPIHTSFTGCFRAGNFRRQIAPTGNFGY
jgi:hypothetical protein